ncbi:MAG: hypothetical protein WAV46_04680 [Candidatus Moraniibacteriota bacterium]
MKIFISRLIFIFVFVCFEFSFFDVLFPWVAAPLVIMSAVVAWSLLMSFPRVLFMTIPLTLFSDIVAIGTPGTLTLYAVLLAYTMSFFSRRFLLEHRGVGLLLYALVSAVGVMGFAVFEFIFSRGNPFSWTKEMFAPFPPLVSFQNFSLSLLLCMPLFLLAYVIIRRFEAYMQYIAQGEALKMR